ncbi:MAG: hypothetical protein OEL54_05215, partial [Flavobacteriaceae bacterium]|nr:hypothetical protein [Flavobacteriaceae bacterium]
MAEVEDNPESDFYCPEDCAEEPLLNLVSIAAIKLYYEDYSLANLQAKINSLVTDHPDIDLVVTPEYLFYGAGFAGLDYRDDPVMVRCENNSCSVESIGTSKSDELKNAVNTVQNIARQNKVNIVLGTVAEMEEISGIQFTFDTQLIIDNQGNIIGKHRMYPLIYPIGESTDYCKDDPDICQQARDSILDTDTTFSLKNKQGLTFEIIPIVCGEKNSDEVISRLSNSNADIAVISEFDVDCNYEDITERIFIGEDIFADAQPFVCEGILKSVFDKWKINNLLREGNILVAEGVVPSAGLFNYDLKQIQDLEITNDYTYGRIRLERIIPTFPQIICGNQACEEGETVENCPQDCKNINLVFISKASDRYVITDMAVWNNKLYYGTNNHGSCEDIGEVYEYPCTLQKGVCQPIGDFDYFQQQGIRYVRYGNNNILVPGLDPPDSLLGSSLNHYNLFVYNGEWEKHDLKPDTGGHLVDAAYFNGRYYVLTNAGLVVVKELKDYSSEGTYLNFEAETYEEKLQLGPASPASLTVWNNELYLSGPTLIGPVVWKYNGEGSVNEYHLIPYVLDFGISKPFGKKLYIKGARGGLYKTENGINYTSVEFFKNFTPSSQNESRMISDIAVLNDNIYVSVMVGQFDIPGEHPCNRDIFNPTRTMNIGSAFVTGYEIYSSYDGVNWYKAYNKTVFVKNYPDINFPIEAMDGKLYVGMTESQLIKGILLLFTNLYTYIPEGVDICDNNGCSACAAIGQPCTIACGDCPKLYSCAPGMDCGQCYPGHPECKYTTCKNNLCGINQWFCG